MSNLLGKNSTMLTKEQFDSLYATKDTDQKKNTENFTGLASVSSLSQAEAEYRRHGLMAETEKKRKAYQLQLE